MAGKKREKELSKKKKDFEFNLCRFKLNFNQSHLTEREREVILHNVKQKKMIANFCLFTSLFHLFFFYMCFLKRTWI